jgi:hypothetical protein
VTTGLGIQVAGKAFTGILGLAKGTLLVRRWRMTRSRIVLHWAIFFLGTVGYLFDALALLGWWKPVATSRLHSLGGLATVVPGAFAGAILMLPTPARRAERLSLYVPLALFLVMAMLMLFAHMEPTGTGQAFLPAEPAFSPYVIVCMVTAALAIAALLHAAIRLRNSAYAGLATALALITVGARMVGQGLASTVLGQVLILIAVAAFHVVFERPLKTA